jgi:hypothetical protein
VNAKRTRTNIDVPSGTRVRDSANLVLFRRFFTGTTVNIACRIGPMLREPKACSPFNCPLQRMTCRKDAYGNRGSEVMDRT